MNSYQFSFKGLWIGGNIIVVAHSQEDAERLAREQVNSEFPNDEITLEYINTLNEPKVIYYDNGDY